MTDEVRPAEAAIPNDVGLHPVAEVEDIETYEERLRKAVTIMLERKQPLDHLVFTSPEGMRTIHLAFPHYENPDKIAFMFKRCPELKLYYPKIRSWFKANNLDWKDSSFNSNRYMRANVDPDIESVAKFVSSAQKEIFGTDIFSALSVDNRLGLHNALLGLRSPMLMLFSAVGIIVPIMLYPLYEIYNLNKLGPFSVSAFDWTEGFFISILFLGVFGLSYSKQNIHEKKRPKKWWVIPFRLLILFFIALAFFTY